ncbi:catalase family protein [Caulobacter sp. S45]|uniref:catalase family protein n=1 Tax=Caulobacter sp. S45 TaxID=1641861 RepID=UPI0015761D2B|nr:catalase family protein [Caulobacter sp. S45]
MLFEPLPALRYDPSDEEVPHDEAETTQHLIDTMRKVSETTLRDEGQPIRSVHAKSHALLQGELEVLDGLSPSLAQGLFARPGRYCVVLRFSTIPGDLLDDSVSTPRGVAMKVVGVEGPRLPGSEGAASQNFVLVNGPAFGAPNPKAFLANLKLLAGTTDKAPGFKKAVSGALQGVQAVIVAVTGEPSPMVATLGGQLETHILGDTFYSQTPFRWGGYVAKVRLKPASPELTALTDKHIKINGVPNALREACLDFFRTTGAVWEFQVQLRTDRKTMPIEDASKVWPDGESHYLTVGLVRTKPQTAWSEARSQAVDKGLSFSPWHGLAAHQPLGGVNRSRRPAYEMGRNFRAEHGARAITEPTEVSLPD